MKRTLLVCVAAVLVAPAGAAAHATLVRTFPANGAVVAHPPKSVRVEFDDTVRVASGNAAVANVSGASVLQGKARAAGRILVLPLRRLHDGAYSVRWSIVSDDGHHEEGTIAFAVGAGSAAPHSVLGASAKLTWSDVTLRALYYLGLLGGAGAAAFGLLSRDVLGERLRRPLAHLLFFALLAVFLGDSGILHSAPPGTRFDLVLKIAVVVALLAGAAAALAPAVPRLLPLAGAGAIALLAAPVLAGHSLDRNQPRVLAPLIDLAHLCAAAAWLGGLLSLVYVLPRTTDDNATRLTVARRFSSAALVAVLVLALSGLTRALTELSHVSQIWSTSYGRALIVKTLLFAPLVVLGWLNRAVLLRAFVRLRRSALLEIALLGGIVVAVAILTELRPGRDTPAASAAAVPVAPRPPTLPPKGAVVDAHELGTLAVAVARTPGSAMVTLLGPDGTGVDGRTVEIDGTSTTSCGAGCYRAPAASGPIHVSVDGRNVTFTVPARAPDATKLLATVTRRYRRSHTIVFDEHLASSPTNGETTRFQMEAPHNLSYTIHSGPAAIVIGTRRWDRERPGAPFVESSQTPLDVTQPYWHTTTNAHEVEPGVITFLDRSIPAWFRVTLHGTVPARTEMTATAHFMVDRYVGFDGPVTISPPPSR